MEINLQYVHPTEVSEQGVIGYSRYGIQLAKQLQARGVTVFDDLPPPDDVPRRGGEVGHEDRLSGIANMVCWVSTPAHAHGWYKDQTPVISTMWEFGRLPEQFREALHEFRTVVVPSKQNQELFSIYHDDVRQIPLGVDGERWKYTPRQEGPFFRFMIGGSGPRKGIDLAHRAFAKVFDGKTPKGLLPQLVMKSPRGFDTKHPNVQVVSGHLTDSEEVGLYETAHCYLQPSRGEGFGLQPLQAIAQGIPTILTNAHGHEGFANLGIGIGWDWIPTEPGASFFGDAGDWWEPDFDELCEAMWDVYSHYDHHLENAAWNSMHVAESWTWENTASKFLGEFGELMGSRREPQEWYTPHNKRYLVIVTKAWAADIGEKSFMWEPKKHYWETADVKRVLWEAQVLHPDCILGDGVHPGSAIDTGLSEHQLGEFAKKSGDHSYCPSCHQRLNTRATHAQDVMAGLA